MSKKSITESKNSFFSNLPKKQKNSFIFLSVLSLGVLILWVWQINLRLTDPFSVSNGEKNVSLNEETENFNQLALNADTDGDGLSDYEEQSLYNTSAYLTDTDGDGISDRDEVNQGTDPLCATGAECNNEIKVADNKNNITIIPEVSNNLSLSNSGEIDGIMNSMLLGQASAEELRVLLLASGVDEQMLAELSDEELMSSYQDMLGQQELQVE